MAVDMLLSPGKAHLCRQALLGTAAILALLVISAVCSAQTPSQNDKAQPADNERAELLQLVKILQERVAKLESQVSGIGPATTPDAKPPATATASGALAPPVGKVPEPEPDPVASARVTKQAGEQGDKEQKDWGTYTPNLGFKIANTEYGDLNVSLYTYIRYLNQLGLDSAYEDAFGNTKSVQRRQDIQIQKLQFKFLGWVLNPKLRYFLYAWTSNATQEQGAQVVLAGNLNYTFNKHLTLGGGIKSLPGTRSAEGNFPFWPGVDSRMIADEFMRPSYTSGFWATGEITDRLGYQVMLGQTRHRKQRFNHDRRKALQSRLTRGACVRDYRGDACRIKPGDRANLRPAGE